MLYSKHWESNKQGHERVDDFGVGRIRSKVLQLGLQTLNQQDVREDILLSVLKRLSTVSHIRFFTSLQYTVAFIQHHRNLQNKLFRCRPVACEGHHIP